MTFDTTAIVGRSAKTELQVFASRLRAAASEGVLEGASMPKPDGFEGHSTRDLRYAAALLEYVEVPTGTPATQGLRDVTEQLALRIASELPDRLSGTRDPVWLDAVARIRAGLLGNGME